MVLKDGEWGSLRQHVPDQILIAVVAELRLYEIWCVVKRLAEFVKISVKSCRSQIGRHLWECRACVWAKFFLEKVGDGVGETGSAATNFFACWAW